MNIPGCTDLNIALVVAEFNGEITSRMQAVASERAEHLGLDVRHVAHVPGSYDMPVVVDALLQRGDIDAVVTLGAVIRGQTKHDEVISHAAARMLSELSVRHKKPVSLGISGPGMQQRHAYARIRPVAERAVDAVMKIAKELDRIPK